MAYELTCRIKPYIQPFERYLALRELKALAGNSPRPVSKMLGGSECFRVRSRVSPNVLVRELTFWEAVYDKQFLTTTQSLRESTANAVRNGIDLEDLTALLPFTETVPLPSRRCLRYGSHGIHEYRGKFFPQLVRNLINIAKVPSKGVVGDPFCGSGTSTVEILLAQRAALALDLNPLSVFMTRTKCALLQVKASELQDAYKTLSAHLLSGRRQAKQYSRLSELKSCDIDYLTAWFHPSTLETLDLINSHISATTSGPIKDFFLLGLSNILRTVSWQKQDDLRVRKEIKPIASINPIKEFLDEIERSTKLIFAFLRQEGACRTGCAEIQEGDARKLQISWKRWKRKVDLIVTSPPYATALPYLDTDRLSLCFLGLLARSEHRSLDQFMIGNREITERSRKAYWDRFAIKKNGLPRSATDLISKIQNLNENDTVGFRRRNLPALLYKYFSDMEEVLVGMTDILKPGASAFIVVGNNNTNAGGKYIQIPTADLLVDIAEKVGFKTLEKVPMEMLISRDIFKKNAIQSESILHLRNETQ